MYRTTRRPTSTEEKKTLRSTNRSLNGFIQMFTVRTNYANSRELQVFQVYNYK